MASDDRDEGRQLRVAFISESLDLLDEVEPAMVELERHGATGGVDPQTLDRVFRLFHTLKGGAACLGLAEVRDLAHGAESLLDGFRSGRIHINDTSISHVLLTCDIVRKLLVTADGPDPRDFAAADNLLRALETLAGGGPGAAGGGPSGCPPSSSASSLPAWPASLAGLQISQTSEMRRLVGEEVVNLCREAAQAVTDLAGTSDDAAVLRRLRAALRQVRRLCGFFGWPGPERLAQGLEDAVTRVEPGGAGGDGGAASERVVAALGFGLDSLRLLATASPGDGLSESGGGDAGDRLLAAFAARLAGGVAGTSAASGLHSPTGSERGAVAVERAGAAKAATVTATGEMVGEGGASVRVEIGKLDAAMALVGELVIAVATVVDNPDRRVAGLHLDRFAKATRELARIAGGLLELTLNMRLVPLAGLFRKQIRVVRDLAHRLGKVVDLHHVGGGIEVDKAQYEAVGDALLHLVRNAVDHGIETPAEREAAGKPASGQISLEARRVGDEIRVTVADDGRGLSRSRLVAAAVADGRLDVGRAAAMSDDEVWRLILEPGFSTVEQVTDVSGRGVGLDVARRNVEGLDGQIDIETTLGRGTRFVLRFPLTLPILEGVLVGVGDERIIIPARDVIEVVAGTGARRLLAAGGGEMLAVGERTLPLRRLADLLDLCPGEMDLARATVVLVGDEHRPIALLVDAVLERQQTAIRNLAGDFGRIGGLAGSSVLPDGRIVLILDVPALVAGAL